MSDRAQIFTRVEGRDPGAPWIVLSHSLAADHTMWDAQLPLLLPHYRVLRYDTRGHGASGIPPGPYSFGDLVGDVVAIMDRHGIARATFMGLSLGGMTGLGLALAHPDRVEKLVCCDARADAPPAFQKSWEDRVAVVTEKGMAGVLAGTIERWLAPSFRALNPHEVARVERMILATPVAGWLGCVAAIRSLDYLKDLAGLKVPTLYVVGADDVGAPAEAMRAMADATPGARLEVIPEAAHLPNVDATERFNAAIAPFLGLC